VVHPYTNKNIEVKKIGRVRLERRYIKFGWVELRNKMKTSKTKEQSAPNSTTDESESGVNVSRRVFLSGTGTCVVGASAWSTGVVAGKPGLDVRLDGSIEEDTELVIRIRDYRGRNQEFAVDDSTQFPTTTTLDRIRTNGEIKFDLLIYGRGNVEIDELDFMPSTGVYQKGDSSPGPLYTIARNTHSVLYSALTYLGISTAVFGVVYYGFERVTQSQTSSHSSARGKKLIIAGIGLLFTLFALGSLTGVLDWIVP